MPPVSPLPACGIVVRHKIFRLQMRPVPVVVRRQCVLIEALEVKLQGRQLQIREVMEIKPEYEKGLFGSVKGIKGVTVSDIENLKATAIKGLEARDRLEKLTFEYERVKKLVPTMDERMRDAQDKIRLEQLEKAFQRLPEHIQKQLLPAKGKSHDRGRER